MNLVTVPHLLEHILGMVAGLRATQYDRTRNGSPDPATPLNVAAFDDGNLIWQALVETVRHVAEWLDLPTPPTARVGWRDETATILGLPPGITVDEAKRAAQTLTRWLEAQQPHLDVDLTGVLSGHIAALSIDDEHPEGRTLTQISGRYPLRDRPTRAKGAACPDDSGDLLIKPPRFHGDPQLIVCTKCGATFTEDQAAEIGRWYTAVQAAAALKERGRKVRAHLAGKYGPAA